MPLKIFFESNGSRRPSFLMTRGRLSSTRSYVVKRRLHLRHSRRLRITSPSLLRRESTTLFSTLAQEGHFMCLLCAPLLVAGQTFGVEGKVLTESVNLLPDLRQRLRVLPVFQSIGDELCDGLHLPLLHAPRGYGRRADADAAGDERTPLLEGDRVLFDRDGTAIQSLFGFLSGPFLDRKSVV